MKSWKSVLCGAVLILLGVLFLGNALSWWNLHVFFDGWWTLFIIVPSIVGLFGKESRSSSVVTLALGILLLLAAQDIIDWNMIWKIFVPIVIIVIGFALILGSNKNKRKVNTKNAKEYVAVFSSVEEKIKEVVSDFKATSIFGDIELDLRKAKIDEDIVIICTTVFGGIDLKLPDGVKVVVNGLPIFGGVENKFDEDKDARVTIFINYTCIFGGVDIT